LGTNIPNTLAFTPAGTPLALFTYLLPILLITLFMAFTHKENLERITLFLVSALITSSLVLVTIYSFPGKDTAPVFLPVQHGYAIAVETLKDTNRLLFGWGPENFVNAYNRTRPATLNLSEFWNIRFTNSSNELFHLVTTTGLIGLITWGLLVSALIKRSKVKSNDQLGQVIKIGTFATLFLFLLLPATYTHLFVFFVLLTLWGLYDKFHHPSAVTNINTTLGGLSLVRAEESGETKESPLSLLPYLIAIPLFAVSGLIFFYFTRYWTAEVAFKNALDAAVQNDGVATYNLQRDAILKNPLIARYRRAYSATNLALANSIAGKEELTEEDRTNITQLIQQSIREAKAAVTLDTQNAANWENLAVVYRSLLGVAENADAWTVASLAQAIQRDPLNPRLRLELGGVYYSVGQYDQAIRLYQQSAELKPDWANAYYNLSSAYRQKNDLAQAFDYLRQVITLVEPDTADYAKAQEELKILADELNVPEADQPELQAPQGDLNVPTPAPTLDPAAQVELPESSGPENIEDNALNSSPTPAPSPTPVPQP
jgi:tetratricopeptide (TPR) repeat protein